MEERFTEKYYSTYRNTSLKTFTIISISFWLLTIALGINSFYTENSFMDIIGFISIFFFIISLIMIPAIYVDGLKRDTEQFKTLENSLFKSQSKIANINKKAKKHEERLQQILSDLKEKDINEIDLDGLHNPLSWDLCRPYIQDKELMFTVCDYFAVGSLIREIEKIKTEKEKEKTFIIENKDEYYKNIEWAEKSNRLLKKVTNYFNLNRRIKDK